MLEIKTVSKGAELVSCKLDGIEKIHDGKSFWNRHAPILFPIVGKLKDNKTEIDGKIYEMTQHGFARDMDFKSIGENEYVLTSNEETLKKYPFNFELYVSYEINENKLKTKYKVKNTSNKDMIFALGGHPAFKCEYSNEEYYLEFEKEESDIKVFQLEDGIISLNVEPKKYITGNKLNLSKDTFENDAIIMKNINSDKITLKRNGEKILTFNFKEFPYLAVWSKQGAPFVCIEPLFNTADKIDGDGIFKNKENIITIKENEEFECSYEVEFFSK